jgi:hypothetical protein
MIPDLGLAVTLRTIKKSSDSEVRQELIVMARRKKRDPPCILAHRERRRKTKLRTIDNSFSFNSFHPRTERLKRERQMIGRKKTYSVIRKGQEN